MATRKPASTPRNKLYIVDDGGPEDIAVWAVNASAAKALVRREHGPQSYNAYEGWKMIPYEAYVFAFPMEDVEAPSKPGLETREAVLKKVGADPRYIKYRETR